MFLQADMIKGALSQGKLAQTQETPAPISQWAANTWRPICRASALLPSEAGDVCASLVSLPKEASQCF